MISNFKEAFKSKNDKKEKIIKQSYDEKWCCTCKYYIQVDDSLPGFITAYPECELGGLAMKTCNNYLVK